MPQNGNTNLAASGSAKNSPARGSKTLAAPRITTTPATDQQNGGQQHPDGSTGSAMSDGQRDIETGSKVTSRDVDMSMQNSPQKTTTSADTAEEVCVLRITSVCVCAFVVACCCLSYDTLVQLAARHTFQSWWGQKRRSTCQKSN